MAKKTKARPAKAGVDIKDPALLCHVGSCLLHFAEAHSADGRNLDLQEAVRMFNGPEVQAWVKAMGSMLPVPRTIPLVCSVKQ